MAVLLADLVSDLKGSVGEAWKQFEAPDDADWKRHLQAAALDFGRIRPLTLVGSVSLEPEVSEYPAPVDFVRFKMALWGQQQIRRPKPWEPSWCGPFPDVWASGGVLFLVPAPTAQQIAVLGADYRFFYYAGVVVSDTPGASTVVDADRGLLLLRAQAEVMRELAMRGVTRPLATRNGYSGMPREGSPAMLARDFLAEFERRAAQP